MMPRPLHPAATGVSGSAPPPDAPREVSQPLTAEAQAEMVAKARAHQGLMTPAAEATISGVKISELASPGMARVTSPSRPPIPPPEGSVALSSSGEGQGVSLPPSPVFAPPTDISADSSPAVSPAALPALPPDATAAEIEDPVVNARPSRGQPRPVADPNLQPMGGFGVPGAEGAFGIGGEGEYFPLDGSEAREVILSLMDQMVEQIQKDLRLTLATTYPLLSVSVTVKVACDQPDQTFFIEQTLDEARGHPPDLVRESLGLSVPRKQAVQTPTGSVMVDRLN